MALKKLEVCDGVTLNIIETDKFKTNYISASFLLPLAAESAAECALLPRVLKRGTVKYPDMTALGIAFDSLYSTNIHSYNYKCGEVQIFGFNASPLDNSYAPDGADILGGTLELLDEIIFHPLLEDGCFKREYVESEKNNLADAVRAKINNKNSYAIRRCEEEMCSGEVYSVAESGTVEEIGRITPESLYARYKEVLSSAKVEIYFVGSCDEDSLVSGVSAIFGKIAHKVTRPLVTGVIRKAGALREITEDQPVAQGKLCIGFRTGSVFSDGNYHEFSLLLTLYGGSTVSKLFMNVREKLSLCYYCSAFANAHKGIMLVASGIEVENRQKAQDEILFQLEECKKGAFTDDELENAKNSIINSYLEISDSPASLEAWYLKRGLEGITLSPEETIGLIRDTGREAVVAAAEKITLDTIYFMRGTLKSGGNDDE